MEIVRFDPVHVVAHSLGELEEANWRKGLRIISKVVGLIWCVVVWEWLMNTVQNPAAPTKARNNEEGGPL